MIDRTVFNQMSAVFDLFSSCDELNQTKFEKGLHIRTPLVIEITECKTF